MYFWYHNVHVVYTVIVLQHQLKLLEAQKRQQELILRRKTEEVSSSWKLMLWKYAWLMYTEIHLIHYGCRGAHGVLSVHISLYNVCQVTALRRQARPTSGKVVRKVNLPEPVQDSSHRPPSGRMYSSGNSAPNGTRWVCVCRCVHCTFMFPGSK